MLFIYSIIAVVSASLQNALIAPIYRKIDDKLLIVCYRGLGITLTLAPVVLVLVPAEYFYSVKEHLPLIFISSFICAIGTWAAIKAVNHLTVGIANTLLVAFSGVYVVLVSILVLDEPTSTSQLIVMLLILLSVSALGLSTSSAALPIDYNPIKGVFFCVVFGIFLGTGFLALGMTARESHPLLVAFLWESLIGFSAMLIFFGRYIIRRFQVGYFKPIELSLKDFLDIALRACLTGVSSSCYAMAMTHGSIPVASAILNLSMVGTTICAVVLYGERLSVKQWSLMFVVCVLVSALKFV